MIKLNPKLMADHIRRTQPELEEIMRQTHIVENMTNLMVMHWNNAKAWPIIRQQLERDIEDYLQSEAEDEF